MTFSSGYIFVAFVFLACMAHVFGSFMRLAYIIVLLVAWDKTPRNFPKSKIFSKILAIYLCVVNYAHHVMFVRNC